MIALISINGGRNMQKIENATHYKCDYCGKISSKAGAMMTHEKHCRKNPHNDNLCLRCGWAISGKAEGNVEEYGWDGPHEYKASALLSYCVKHKEFMSLRQSDRYADGLTGGNYLIAKYADEGCSDFTKEGKVPCAYELGFSMPKLIKALCDNKNVTDVICDILKRAHAIWNKDTQHFIEQLRNE